MDKAQRICVIPARGGSKGIPDKNIREFLGKPLICHSIDSALESNLFKYVLVSSDSEKILKISSEYSDKIIPIKRPSELSNDIIMPDAAVTHSLKKAIEIYGYLPELTTFLHPTSPLRRVEDIQNCNFLLEDGIYNSVVSVHQNHDFYWTKSDKGGYAPSYSEKRPRRQDFHRLVENGSIYVTRSAEFIKNNNRIVKKTMVYEIPQEYSFQIDSHLDLEWLSFLGKKIKNEN